ncbi:polyprenyl synthetase family protein [Cryobacterium sp. 10C3]|uniref:polyprenyl synthetase family protein n=1 Tax=Cryobacterium sp. 10C3 TaxID=3048577 RepID=UPI002AB51574|nr:polyprenyl synthetase family protein [Cryobacterium sp. 10C3]MDY7556700.1 polyprenyl synthetase family protein [Cryobacterium sp. 10C3]
MTLEQKTAVYSFEAPLMAGAVLAGASEEAIVALGRFGRLVGVAFQLTDDILGVFGDPARTGKSALTDLREGKQTALVAYAGTTGDWPAIAPFVGKADLTQDEAEEARVLLRSCGALQSTDELAIDHARRAVAALDTAAIPAVLRTTLTQLADTSVNRSR